MKDSHPNKQAYLSNLSLSPQACFPHLGETLDLENCILNLPVAIKFTQNGHPNNLMYFSNLGMSQHSHYKHISKLANLEDSIFKLKPT